VHEEARLLVMDRGELSIVVNLSDEERRVPVVGERPALLLATAPGVALGADEVVLPARSAAILGPVADSAEALLA
jgi:maltooligosyltrehalose trehalohydrolase